MSGNIKTKNLPPLLAILLLLVAMISIHSGAALAKSLFPIIGAEGLIILRQAIGSMILLIVFRPWRIRLHRSTLLPLFFYGISLGAMNYFFYLSLNTLPLGIAVALEFTGPLMVSVFSSRRKIDFLWLIMTGSGLYILLPLGKDVGPIDLVGAAYALGAGASWAIYIITGQKTGRVHGPSTVAIGSLIASLIFCPISFLQSTGPLLSLSILPTAFVVAFLSTALPYSIEIIALPQMSARTFGTLMSLEPAMAALFGMIFLHENISLIQWCALGIIIAASTGAALSTK